MKPATPPSSSIRIDAHGLTLHALERNRNGSPALLLLHGWLDHSHAFDWLCDELPAAWRQIALDFRGMGQSAHLPAGALYNFTDYLADVEAVLHELHLPAVHLVGHSMGGTVALFFAAAHPERVRSVTAIESLGPGGGAPENAVTRLRRYVADLAKPSQKRTYSSLEEAAARVREKNTGLSEQVAWQLTRFGMNQVPGGYEFSFDPAHRKRFGFAFDEEQILAVLRAVQCNVQVIHATGGFTFDDDVMKARLSSLGDPVPILVEGSHHVHMDRPAEVAAHIARFIESIP